MEPCDEADVSNLVRRADDPTTLQSGYVWGRRMFHVIVPACAPSAAFRAQHEKTNAIDTCVDLLEPVNKELIQILNLEYDLKSENNFIKRAKQSNQCLNLNINGDQCKTTKFLEEGILKLNLSRKGNHVTEHFRAETKPTIGVEFINRGYLSGVFSD
ncbi:hypothetical protein GQ53DRAFT_770063 [Thozetella sp. PMI_491]|nr:hypothetical protein GQ53DRAFT_770063 [Thozetella sp. PMI_491]